MNLSFSDDASSTASTSHRVCKAKKIKFASFYFLMLPSRFFSLYLMLHFYKTWIYNISSKLTFYKIVLTNTLKNLSCFITICSCLLEFMCSFFLLTLFQWIPFVLEFYKFNGNCTSFTNNCAISSWKCWKHNFSPIKPEKYTRKVDFYLFWYF